MTHFGYSAVASDPELAQGGVLYKLLMRAFPGWYEYNTVYAMFPFTIPSENHKILTTRGIVSQYSFKAPTKPQAEIVFSTAGNAKKILGNQKKFNVIWGAAISRLSGGVDYMLSADKPANTKQHAAVVKAIYTDVPDGMEEVWDFYTRFTEKLLKERSYLLDDFYQVDAVREYPTSLKNADNSVVNMVHVHFVSQLFNLPLKTEETPFHPFTEKQMYDILALLFGYVFLDRDEVQSFTIRKLAAESAQALSTLVSFNVKEISLGGWVKKLADGIKKDGFLDSYGNAFIRRLLDAGMPIEEIVWIIMPTAAAGTANQGQQVFPAFDAANFSLFKCSIFISLTGIKSIGLKLFDWLIWMMKRRGRNCVHMPWKHVVYPPNHTDSSVVSQRIV